MRQRVPQASTARFLSSDCICFPRLASALTVFTFRGWLAAEASCEASSSNTEM